MTPEQWQEVKKVLATALERAPEERQAYLNGVCAEPSLRREVESLIAAHEQGDSSFLDRPAVEGGVLKSGTKLGPYEILAPLGAGGMGEVYRARDTRLERDVAVKILPPGLLADEAARRRFRNEALALAKLNHANIGVVYEFDRQGDLDFLVMEYVPGATLAERLTKGALPEKEVAALGMQIAAALEEAHEHGLVHRDLKPGNIMVTPKGQAKVLDFGLARLLRPMGQATAAAELLTETQGLAGTLPYMAPEQLRGEPADARTDIHAAGAVLYEMATGQRPFSQAYGPQLIAAILNEMPRPPSSLNPRVSRALESAILKALDKEPENRYQSAKELGVDLRRLVMPTSAPTVQVVAQNHRFRRAALAAGLAALLLLAIPVGLNLGGWRQRLFGRSDAGRIPSIAVLPFKNLSSEPGSDYFSDGLTDEIIRNLSIIDGLQVRSRTSSFTFKDKPRNIHEVGVQLGANLVLEGSVLRSGDKLRINAQLVRVSDDVPLWSQRFDRELKDVFAIQDEISRGIVNNLRLKLGRGQRRYETSVEAYELYLRARTLFFTDVQQRIGLFEEAIAKDPSFAPAYAGLAEAYASRSVHFPVEHPPDDLVKMRVASEKAIQLDPLLAEAHDALGVVFARDGQWEQAEKSFRRAIELDPNGSSTYLNYSYYLLTVLGRVEENLQQLRVAEKADPLSPDVRHRLAVALILAGRYSEAAEHCLKLPADHPLKWLALAHARLGQGRTGEAIQILVNDQTNLMNNPQERGLLGYAYARSGRREEAEKMASASPYANEQALIFAGLGDKDRTLEALDRMTALGAVRVGSFLNSYPELAFLRDDPRAKALRKKIGLPE